MDNSNFEKIQLLSQLIFKRVINLNRKLFYHGATPSTPLPDSKRFLSGLLNEVLFGSEFISEGEKRSNGFERKPKGAKNSFWPV